MRSIVFSLVTEALGAEFGNGAQVFSSGAVREDNLPPSPFAVVRLGISAPGMGEVRRASCTVWIHSKGADYAVIDDALQSIYGRLSGAEHVSEQGGSAELIRAEWESTSDDLYDPGFRTITKNSLYRLIGTGA